MAESDDGEDLPVGLEILPGARWSSSEDVLEVEAAALPRLVRERALLVLRVEGADGGEVDPGVAGQHGDVVAEAVVGDGAADGDDGDADHRSGLHAHVRLHLQYSDRR